MLSISSENLQIALEKAVAAYQSDNNDKVALDAANAFTRELMRREQEMPPFDPTTGEYIPDQPKPEKERSIVDTALGLGETALTLGTGATTGALGGIGGAAVGLGDTAFSGDFGTMEGAENVQDYFEKGMALGTYTPKTEAGQEFVGDVGKALQGTEALTTTAPYISTFARTVKPRISNITRSKVSPELQQKQQTQLLLQQEGGTLTAFQTGQAGKLRNMAEKIGDLGLLSKGIAEGRRDKNADILARQVQQMVNGDDAALVLNRSELGEAVANAISEGKKASIRIYGNDLDSLRSLARGSRLKTGRVIGAINKFSRDNSGEAGSFLDDSTVSTINNILERLRGKPKDGIPKGLGAYTKEGTAKLSDGIFSNELPVAELFDELKRLNGIISERGNFQSQGFNSTSSRELSQLSNIIKSEIDNQLGAQGYRDIASRFNQANATFAKINSALLPDSIKNIITKSTADSDFERLGNILLSANDVGRINKLMGSIDTAFDTMNKANVLPEGINSPQQLKKAVRQSYLNNIFGGVGSNPQDLFSTKFSKLYGETARKTKKDPVKAIMGEDYGNYKRLIGAIKNASEKQKDSALVLSLRSKEIGAASVLAGGIAIGAGETGLAATAALSVLMTPVVLGKLATNPKAVEKLLKLDKINMSDPSSRVQKSLFVIDQVINSFEEDEDRKVIRKALKEEKERLRSELNQ